MKIREDMKNHPLAIAARETNEWAEEGIEAACKKLGLKVEDVYYVAEQRAYRVLYAMRGINLTVTAPLELKLQPEDVELMVKVIIPAYMDGLAIGWRAQQIEQKENK